MVRESIVRLKLPLQEKKVKEKKKRKKTNIEKPIINIPKMRNGC